MTVYLLPHSVRIPGSSEKSIAFGLVKIKVEIFDLTLTEVKMK